MTATDSVVESEDAWPEGGCHCGGGRFRIRLRARRMSQPKRFVWSMLRRSLLATIAVVISTLATLGCGESFVAAEAVRECSEVATQCRLEDGPLGVCERRPCAVNESPPCFVCTPQH